MVAVFCSRKERYKELNIIPKTSAFRVRNPVDLLGVKITSVVRLGNISEWPEGVRRAYLILGHMQKDLFNV